MSSINVSTINPIYAQSLTILRAQKVSSIVWAILCAGGLLMCSLQVITTALWRPLRKIEQSLILAIALGDLAKALGYAVVAAKRLVLLSINRDEVTSQKMCLVWILGIPIPTHFVSLLLVAVSLDRVLALVVPVWYKNRKMGFKLFLVGFSLCCGTMSGCAIFIGASDDLMQPVCAYGTSPTEKYRTYATWFENSAALLTVFLNLISCGAVLFRWRSAVKAKKDMKAFKKNIQLNALKTLVAVVGLFLISSAMGTLWLSVPTMLKWDDVTKMSYTPLGGCFGLIRGVLDFPLYLLMVREYRKGFANVIWKWQCNSKIANVASSTALVSGLQRRANVNTTGTVAGTAWHS